MERQLSGNKAKSENEISARKRDRKRAVNLAKNNEKRSGGVMAKSAGEEISMARLQHRHGENGGSVARNIA